MSAVLVIIVQLIFLEGILSLDNAAALGAMVARLPNDKAVPWPSFLRSIGHKLDRFLGMQRDAALKVGLLGAYGGRGLMLLLATIIIQNPWLRLLGGLYLFYLALSHLGELGHNLRDTDTHQQRNMVVPSFWFVVLQVELADLAFSLDNVIAAVALSDEYWVVLLGVGIGIVIMRFAAGLFSRLIAWEPNFETMAYLLIGAISIELILDDLFGIHFVPFQLAGLTINAEVQQFGITIMIILLTLAFSRVRWLRSINFIWRPFLIVFSALLSLLQWLLLPFKMVRQLFAR